MENNKKLNKNQATTTIRDIVCSNTFISVYKHTYKRNDSYQYSFRKVPNNGNK